MVDPLPAAVPLGDPAGDSQPTQIAVGLDGLLVLAGERLGEEITPRTVRLYATQGLIDRPGKDGRSAVYGYRHLLQLLLIRSLARRGLSLAAIAPLCGLADQELEQQLAQLEAPGDASHQEREAALDYLRALQSSTPAAPSAAVPGFCESSPSLLNLLGSPLTTRPPSQSPTRSPSRSAGSREAASRWHRFSLAPGVELHISDAASIPAAGPRRLSWFQRLMERLIEQLDDRPG
ncbi:MerR family transcriptional regulator [Vulcanococcus limneticus]|uniref:MerR family transcriptional regulator n=1 Tax=Vulcanococcus limneticus TaxID=2170428 RepID=UPI00398BCA7B